MVNRDLVSAVNRYFDVIYLAKCGTQACTWVNCILTTTEAVNPPRVPCPAVDSPIQALPGEVGGGSWRDPNLR